MLLAILGGKRPLRLGQEGGQEARGDGRKVGERWARGRQEEAKRGRREWREVGERVGREGGARGWREGGERVGREGARGARGGKRVQLEMRGV